MTSAPAMSRRAKLLEDHEKNMMSETNKVISEEAEDARKVRESYAQQASNNRKLFDLDVVKEGEKCTENVKRGISRLDDLRVENRLTLTKLNEDQAKSNRQKLQDMEKNGQNEVEQRKNRVQIIEKKIQDVKNTTEKERERELRINGALQAEKTNIAQKLESKKTEKRESHEKKIMELEQKSADIRLKHEEEMKKMEEVLRIKNEKQMAEVFSLQEKLMTGNGKMIEAAHNDRKHNDFRRQCRMVVHLFNEARKHFDDEELLIMFIISEIKNERKLTANPLLGTITNALQNLLHAIQMLAVPDEQYEVLQIKVQRIASDLTAEIKKIEREIFSFKNVGKGDIESLELSHETARALMLQLSELVLLFNIRPSTQFGEVLALEVNNLSITSSPSEHKLENSRLENGSKPEIPKAINNISANDEIEETDEGDASDEDEDQRELRYEGMVEDMKETDSENFEVLA
ncbi:hypothetical protein CRE_17927 [Caenorhabditis remanei]|uniref:Uncharacterized protein n=1 Tax=Caenorhabditis remanei TaxID=31234 RepID=E3MDL1_CAERE|nr:hypothetical protein CRE_17927 [Caenorhabditis remanei]